MRKKRYQRISITLPAELLRVADREAARLGRSRSWVLAEAVRRLGEAEATPASGAEPAAVVEGRTGAVREMALSPYDAESSRLDAPRREQLRRDMGLTAEQRLQASDEAVRLADLVHPRRRLRQVVFFDDYLEYLEWKRVGRLPR